MIRVLIFVLLAGCSSLNPLDLLTGGGVNTAANVQAGKTNTQSVGQTNVSAPKVSVRPNARVETVDQSTNTKNELPTLVWIVAILLFIIGWVTDTPATYIKNFKKKKKAP